jgi:ribA/ribD-fused uncharacterized protein
MCFENTQYERHHCVTFRKTNEVPFGGLSNMSDGYLIVVNGARIKTSEALYQVCRFPMNSQVQKLIIEQASPMGAKMKSKPYREAYNRPDWDDVRVEVMRWCLRVKLACNWVKFGRLLLSTGDRPIVEDSHKDRFWGAVEDKKKPDVLEGQNVLGCLLKELRDELRGPNRRALTVVEPLPIADFLLFGQPIGRITVGEDTWQRGEAVFARMLGEQAA